MSMGSTFIALSSARCSGVLFARIAPKRGECSVFTLPESACGRFMSSWRLRTGTRRFLQRRVRPARGQSVMSKPASSLAKSTTPVLSATLMSAVLTWTRCSSMIAAGASARY